MSEKNKTGSKKRFCDQVKDLHGRIIEPFIEGLPISADKEKILEAINNNEGNLN